MTACAKRSSARWKVQRSLPLIAKLAPFPAAQPGLPPLPEVPLRIARPSMLCPDCPVMAEGDIRACMQEGNMVPLNVRIGCKERQHNQSMLSQSRARPQSWAWTAPRSCA